MKAIVQTKYGPPDVLQLKEVEKPVPEDNEVLIKIHATTVTAVDCTFRQGSPFIGRFFSGLTRPKKPILGAEFAGEIEAIGKDVELFEERDQVFGSTGTDYGCYAEYVCMPEKGFLAKKPANLTYEEAAPVCGAVAAWNFLKGFSTDANKSIIFPLSSSFSLRSFCFCCFRESSSFNSGLSFAESILFRNASLSFPNVSISVERVSIEVFNESISFNLL